MNFFCRLNAPRPTFAQDLSAAEAQLMQDHAAYWREWMAKGNVIAFGLVADPKGAYGVGLVDFDSAEAARAFADADPTIRAHTGFAFDVFPMPMGVVTRG